MTHGPAPAKAGGRPTAGPAAPIRPPARRPLLVATDPGLDTIVIGIVKMIGVETQTDWSAAMATAVLALLPPIVVVVLMQRWFVAGLTEGEK